MNANKREWKDFIGVHSRSFAFIRGSSSQKGFFADFDSTPTPNADIAKIKGSV
jgi:hypothetical protein